MTYVEGLKEISPQELGLLGREDVAYVKSVVSEGQPAFAVHAADGTQIAVMGNRDLAFAGWVNGWRRFRPRNYRRC
jgi:hypothetical protein